MLPPEPYLLVIYTVALASLARLITIDSLFDRPRDALVSATASLTEGAKGLAQNVTARLDDRPWSLGRAVAISTCGLLAAARFAFWCVGSWVTCPWCASFPLALLFLWAQPHWDNPIVLTLALAMAMRQIAGLLADR